MLGPSQICCAFPPRKKAFDLPHRLETLYLTKNITDDTMSILNQT